MCSRESFENTYSNYKEGKTSILNNTQDGVSEFFLSKLQCFTSSKLHLLKTEMKNDIYCDGTVYTGSAGLAFYYLMSSIEKNEVANDSLQIALSYINISNLKGKRITFLCGDAGPLAIAAVISFKLDTNRPDSLPEYKTIVKRLLALASLIDDCPDEVLYGKSGYLYALLFVNKHIGADVVPASHIEKVISGILNSGKDFAKKMKSESPLLWQWHDKVYFGAAHGMAGILYLLLQARRYIKLSEMSSFIKPTLQYLLKQQFPSGNYPSSLGSSSGDRLVQWCHGAPGFVPLCLLAHQTLEDEKYLKLAEQLGDVIWERGLLTKGYSICHGVSGNAYAFIQLYQATKKPIHLHRAGCFMDWCMEEKRDTEMRPPDRPASLFEGLVGRLHLAQQFNDIQQAKFPAFTI